MDKRGVIKIIEVTIAIALIISVLVVVFTQKNDVPLPDFSEKARSALRIVAENETLRNQILVAQNYNQRVIDTINASLPPSFNFELRACTVSSVCGQSSYQGNVYSAERVISADTRTYRPVKLRLFIWQKSS